MTALTVVPPASTKTLPPESTAPFSTLAKPTASMAVEPINTVLLALPPPTALTVPALTVVLTAFPPRPTTSFAEEPDNSVEITVPPDRTPTVPELVTISPVLVCVLLMFSVPLETVVMPSSPSSLKALTQLKALTRAALCDDEPRVVNEERLPK
jgi:hypothetical protein